MQSVYPSSTKYLQYSTQLYRVSKTVHATDNRFYVCIKFTAEETKRMISVNSCQGIIAK